MIEIRRLGVQDREQSLGLLAGVLTDCVESNASVGFMLPFPASEAEAFYRFVFDEVANGRRILLAAFQDGDLVGTVQLLVAMPPNQAHRADVAKLLVKSSARKRGIAEQLMRAVEEAAWNAGKNLLVLDTVVGESGERLYARLGWTRVGVIPNYARFPKGDLCGTAVFWKQLSR